MKFMGSRPIFIPLHVWDIMKEVNNMFSPNMLNPKNPLTSMNTRMKVLIFVDLFIDPSTFD
jgi:hypothetical protein